MSLHKQSSPPDKQIIDELLHEYHELSKITVRSLIFGEFNEHLGKTDYTCEEIAERLMNVIDTLVSFALAYDFDKTIEKSDYDEYYYAGVEDIFRKYYNREYSLADVDTALAALECDIDCFADLSK
jgi:hypothetical protein